LRKKQDVIGMSFFSYRAIQLSSVAARWRFLESGTVFIRNYLYCWCVCYKPNGCSAFSIEWSGI